MEITIEHHGIRLTLGVYSEDGLDLFEVCAIEAIDAPYDIAELAKLLTRDGLEIQRLANEELSAQRELIHTTEQEECAA
jgi:hypothetical protein